MNQVEIQALFAGLSVVLALLQQAGVKAGHLGSTDFIPIAEQAAQMLSGVITAQQPAVAAATPTAAK